MAIPDSEVIGELTTGGASVNDHFLIGYEICCVNGRGELMSLLIDDLPGEEEGEMHLACVEYLRRIGAKEYPSPEEYERLRRRC